MWPVVAGSDVTAPAELERSTQVSLPTATTSTDWVMKGSIKNYRKNSEKLAGFLASYFTVNVQKILSQDLCRSEPVLVNLDNCGHFR